MNNSESPGRSSRDQGSRVVMKFDKGAIRTSVTSVSDRGINQSNTAAQQVAMGRNAR